MVLALAPASANYDGNLLKSGVLRLVTGVHRSESHRPETNRQPFRGRFRRGGGHCSGQPGRRSSSSADPDDFICDEDYEDDASLEEPDPGGLHHEEGLEALAAESAELGDGAYEMFDNDTTERIGLASALLDSSPDALETIRAARTLLAERKGRGSAGASKGRGRSPAGRRAPNRKCSGRGGRGSTSIAERKAKSVCKACGQCGHWASDPGCGTNHAPIAERHRDPQGLPLQSGPLTRARALVTSGLQAGRRQANGV